MFANSGSNLLVDLLGITRRCIVLGCLALTLCACGGGGGGNEPTPPSPGGGTPNNPPPPQPPTDQQRAQNAKLTIVQFDPVLFISWLDTFDDELGYEVQQQLDGGDWQVVESLPPVEGGFTQWLRAIDASSRYRVMVRLDASSLPLHAAADVTEIAVQPSPQLSIQLDQSEPVGPNVQASMPGAAPALSVTYYLDSAQVAKVSNETLAATLPTPRLVNGTRFLLGMVEKSPGLWLAVSRQIQIDNPNIAVLLSYTAPQAAGEPFSLVAQASSDAGITSVEFFIDGSSVQVDSTPDITGAYVYTADPATLSSGTHAIRAVAMDGSAATVSMEAEIQVDRYPSLTVTGPFDGMISSGGSLNVHGTFGDDAPGATLAVSLGGERLLRTQTSPFTLNHSLAALPSGEHSLNVRVHDASGRVSSRLYQVIVPSTPLQYELIAYDAAELLATDQGALLYEKNSGDVVLRTAEGIETAGPTQDFISQYWLSDGRVVGRGQDSHVYVFGASGQGTDLTPNPSMVPAQVPTVRGPWLTWVPFNAPTQLATYDVRSGQLSNVTFGGTANLQSRFDIITTPGHEQVLLQATVGGVSGIYRYTLSNGAIELVRAGVHTDVRTDGTRLAWRDLGHLISAPLDNPTATTTVTANVQHYLLEDGVIAWRDNQNNVNVYDGVTATQLGALTTPNDYILKDGRVIFATGGKTHIWNRASGARVLVDAVVPTIHSNGVAYFRTGTSGTLYRVTLP